MGNKSYHFKIGPLTLQIKKNYYDHYFNIWSHKMDPYLTDRSDNSGDTAITISFANRPYPTERKLLRCDNYGFYACYITEDKNHTIYYQYMRKATKKIFFTISVDEMHREICLLEDHTNSYHAIPFEFLGIIIPNIILNYGFLSFHGVLMEYEGNGIIISAASGTGKTTHARLWRDLRRALIINGDRAVCAKTAEGWTGYGLPWSGTSGEQINRSVAIRALVVLRRGETNEAHRISALEAFHQVFAHVLYPSWDKALTEKMMDLLESFLRDVPIFLLSCRPDAESVDVLHDALAEVLHE